MIDTQKVKHLLDLVDIETVADDLGLLERMRRGSNAYSGPCPFCHAAEHKFYIYPNHRRGTRGWYRCYRASCNAHGDALELVRRLRDLNFGQAVARLAQMAGLNLGKLQTLDLHAGRRR